MSKGKITKVLVANRGEISCRAQVGGCGGASLHAQGMRSGHRR